MMYCICPQYYGVQNYYGAYNHYGIQHYPQVSTTYCNPKCTVPTNQNGDPIATCASLGATNPTKTIISCTSPCSGQSQRSSENFQVPTTGDYLITAPPGVSFNVLHAVGGGGTDENFGRFGNGIVVKNLKEGNYNYYIGAPSVGQFGGPFPVCFTLQSKS